MPYTITELVNNETLPDQLLMIDLSELDEKEIKHLYLILTSKVYGDNFDAKSKVSDYWHNSEFKKKSIVD